MSEESPQQSEQENEVTECTVASETPGSEAEIFRPFLLLHSPTKKQSLLAAVFFFFLLLVDKFNVFSDIATHAFGGSTRDGGLYLWLFRQNANFFSFPWFDTQAFYPYGMTLAWSDNFLLPALSGNIITLLGASTLSAYNVTLLTALFLNGYCTYQLAHRITGAYFASLIAGAGFGLYSFFTHHAGHPQLLFAFWIPLSILFTCFYLSTLKKRSLLVACLCISGSFLCSVYYALFIALLIPIFLFGIFLVRPNYFGKRQCTDYVIAFFTAMVPIIPFALPYLETQNLFGSRQLYEPFFFSASGLSYLTVTQFHLVYGSILSELSHMEATLFPGFTLLVFLVAALKRLAVAKQLKRLGQITVFSVLLLLFFSDAGKQFPILLYTSAVLGWLSILLCSIFLHQLGALERSREYYVLSNRNFIAVFLFTGLIFLVLSLGPLGNIAENQYALSPFAVLFTSVPGMGAIRAAGRFGVIAIWCVFMTLPFLLPLLRHKKNWGPGFYILSFLLLAVENMCSTYPLEQPAVIPTAYMTANHSLSESDAAIAIPVSPTGSTTQQSFSLDAYARHSVNTMLWSQGGAFRLVNGYSGQISALHKNLSGNLLHFPDLRSLSALGSIPNLTHIFYHGDEVEGFDKERFATQLENSPLLKILSEENSTYLLEFTPETRLTDTFKLLVPPNQAGTLQLELKALYQKDSPEFRVDMFIETYHADAPLASLPVQANDVYEEFSVRLPETTERMRPLKIYFTSNAPGQIYLRRRHFQTDQAIKYR